MGRPSYAALAAGYQRKSRVGFRGVDQAALYESIGHPEFSGDPRMENTCATRVSLALLAAGIAPAPGNLTVLAGKFARQRIETNQKALSKFLKQRLGLPEVYKSGYEAWQKIRPRRGIVSFFHITGAAWDNQGHIDLVEPAAMEDLQCVGACYWSSTEVWFWPLK
jgi:hypothetical protein